MWLYSLKESLQPIESQLKTLIAPEAMDKLQSVTSYFPDAIASTYGFEYRLHPEVSEVDFAFQVTEGGRAILAGLNPHVCLNDSFTEHPVWQRISKFCAEWSDPSSILHYYIGDLWLEFDLPQNGNNNNNNVPIPGLFFRIEVPPENMGMSFSYDWIWEKAIPCLLGRPLDKTVQEKLIDSIRSLPPMTSIFQVGLMLSREVEAVRLCLISSPREILLYLTEIGWKESLEPIEKIVSSIYPLVDGIILDIDIGKQIYPRIGIEGIYLSRYLACVNGQWESLLNHLTSEGLCPQATRDTLLKYTGYTFAKPMHQRIYVRGLNHIKFIYQPGQPLAAKIYFGTMHKPISEIPNNSSTNPTETLNNEQIDVVGQTTNFGDGASINGSISINRAIENGVTFLLNARNSEKWWYDFYLAAGLSDEWVTGYVGTMLANIPDRRIPEAATDAWNLLLSRHHRLSGKWGYNKFPPGDADSTGWALQLATSIGEINSERAQQAMQSLTKNKQPDGGISTYEEEKPIRSFIHATPTQGFAGWCGSHICVSAAIALLPQWCEQLQDYLLSTQNSDGSWSAYWWHDHEYSTALAAEAIAKFNPQSKSVASAVIWGINRLSPQGFVATDDHPNGSPFATAWCLRLLGLGRQDAFVQQAIAKTRKWLLEQQQSDGSWAASARLRVPLPDDENPNEYDKWVYNGKIQGSLAFDQYRIFTTATVIQALHQTKA